MGNISDKRYGDVQRKHLQEMLESFAQKKIPVSIADAVAVARKTDGVWSGFSDEEIADIVAMAASRNGQVVKFDGREN